MNYVQARDRVVQQRLDHELADVLTTINVTMDSIARNLQILNDQRKAKGVNHDKR